MLRPSDVSTGGVEPQANEFEQVSSDGHQMSLAGGSGQRQSRVSCLMSEEVEVEGAGLYSEVQCTMDNGHMRTPQPP